MYPEKREPSKERMSTMYAKREHVKSACAKLLYSRTALAPAVQSVTSRHMHESMRSLSLCWGHTSRNACHCGAVSISGILLRLEQIWPSICTCARVPVCQSSRLATRSHQCEATPHKCNPAGEAGRASGLCYHTAATGNNADVSAWFAQAARLGTLQFQYRETPPVHGFARWDRGDQKRC